MDMDLRVFFKQDREEKTTEYPASSLFKDEKGNIIKWKDLYRVQMV